jgi:glycosyltransferase involved in cell wall biosynthesis
MKILVTGYACDPFRGSEPGVGWRAVCRIARNHEVCVLTDIHNKAGWDRAAAEGIIPPNVSARFIRKLNNTSENRWIAHLQSWMNCAAFNRLVLDAARKWHAEEQFDLCHQITVAGWRMPSPLWQLPVPFVWGPIGGAGYIPWRFRGMLSPSGLLLETLRDINTAWSRSTPAFRKCIRNASVVFVANQETEEFLRPYRDGRTLVKLPIASMPEEAVCQFARPAVDPAAEPTSLRLFAGGNMEARKGGSIALKALAEAKRRGLAFRYTLAGGGPDVPNLIRLRDQLGLQIEVEFREGYAGDEYIRALQEADVYFLPSFRESTPVTLLEACLSGCYPVVADTSAQGEIVRAVGGSAVPIESVTSLINGLADALIWCAANRKEMQENAQSAAVSVADLFSSQRYDDALRMAYSQPKPEVSA